MRAGARRVFVVAALALLPARARATGAAAGSIEGIVTLDGPAPRLEPLKVIKDAASCGAERPNEAIVVGKNGGLRNVVVALKDAPPPPAPPPPTAGATVDQQGCQYLPHVQAATVGTSLTLMNNDRVLHNVHGSIGPVQTFNLAMPIKGQKLPARLTRPGIIRLQCDAGHSWMSAFIHVFDHPYFAVTGDDGHFVIKDVPPGAYTLELWHEALDPKSPGVTRTFKVNVKDGVATSADATLKL